MREGGRLDVGERGTDPLRTLGAKTSHGYLLLLALETVHEPEDLFALHGYLNSELRGQAVKSGLRR